MSDSSLNFVSGKRGRKPIHASDSERLANWRASRKRLEVDVPLATFDKLTAIASDLDCKRNELLQSLIKFALLNRDWRRLGLWGSEKDVDRLRKSLDKGSGNASAD